MNDNIIKYRGYSAAIEYSVEDKVLHGKIDGINDLVNFCSEDINSIEEEFHKAVDGYLDLCEKLGKSPDKTYSGSFNIRIAPELHKKIAIKAMHEQRSLNSEVENAIETYLSQSDVRVQYNIVPDIVFAETIHTYQGTHRSASDWNGGNSNGFNFQRTSQVVTSLN